MQTDTTNDRELLANVTCPHCGAHDFRAYLEITFGVAVVGGELWTGPQSAGHNGLPFYVTCNACGGEIDLMEHANDSYEGDVIAHATVAALARLIPQNLLDGEW